MFRYLKLALATIVITITISAMRIGLMIPFLKKKVLKCFTDLAVMGDEEMEGCICHLKMLKETVRQVYIDIFKEAKLGKDAPDVRLVPVRRKQESSASTSGSVNLSELMEPGIPLVVTFGSCSCPPFFRKLKAFGEIAIKNASIANFLVIYIEEAHPTDGWMFKDKKIAIATHRNLEDRVNAAGFLSDVLPPGVDICADLMSNNANHVYGGFPERLYVILDGKIEYQGGIGPFYYDIGEVKIWLDNYQENLDIQNSNA